MKDQDHEDLTAPQSPIPSDNSCEAHIAKFAAVVIADAPKGIEEQS